MGEIFCIVIPNVFEIFHFECKIEKLSCSYMASYMMANYEHAHVQF